MSNESTLVKRVPGECADGNHVAGLAGNRSVLVKDWEAERVRFQAVIEDFNVRGQRQQINHPGWFTRHNFCSECGADLRSLPLAPLY
jgi:hypothetical protein